MAGVITITDGTDAPPDDGRKAFADRSDRHGGDQRLRRHGFTIAARPANGPALWRRNGVACEEDTAHRIVDRELAALEAKGS